MKKEEENICKKYLFNNLIIKNIIISCNIHVNIKTLFIYFKVNICKKKCIVYNKTFNYIKK